MNILHVRELSKFAAQGLDVHIERTSLAEVVVIPYRREYLLSRNDIVATLHKQFEQLVLFKRELHFVTLDEHSVLGIIDGDFAYGYYIYARNGSLANIGFDSDRKSTRLNSSHS